MCTLALAWRVFAEAPTAVAANRDESLDRPSEPPAVRDGDPPSVAPRDAVAGGTWIGCTGSGLVVAVTNRWLDADRAGDRSRGLLVDDCLRAGSAAAALRVLEGEVAERAYAGFNLVLADDDDAFCCSYDGELDVTRLEPGVHVVGNVGGVVNGRARFAIPDRRAEHGADRADSARRVARALAPRSEENATAWLDRAGDVLSTHAYGACLHGDGFGTRSFSRIRTGPDPEFAFADGPPCETPAEPVALPDGFSDDSDR